MKDIEKKNENHHIKIRKLAHKNKNCALILQQPPFFYRTPLGMNDFHARFIPTYKLRKFHLFEFLFKSGPQHSLAFPRSESSKIARYHASFGHLPK